MSAARWPTMGADANIGTRVHSFDFSTDGLPRKDQFAAWRASWAAAFDLTELESGPKTFSGRQKVWDLGGLAFSRVHTDELAFAGLAGHVRREPLDHWLLTLFVNGRSTTLADNDRLDGRTGAVQLHPLGRVFEGTVSQSDILMLFVPRDLCREMTHVLDAAAFSRLEGAMGRIFADYMVSLARRLPRLEASDASQVVATTRAMLLACVAPSPDRLEEAGNMIANVLLERARRYIQANLHDPELGARGLLRELGVSRSRLYRLFEPSGGVMHYIQRRRLLAAHSMLADANNRRRIFEIAESCCFADGADFSRAFRREFGCSPSDVRAGTAHVVPDWKHGEFDEEGAPAQRLNTLLRRLQG
ncbi:helix-turn-helix domain-containing protein [Devosia geojensis]|nr:AraC family transcriptional regulator [Devosia geojensis]